MVLLFISLLRKEPRDPQPPPLPATWRAPPGGSRSLEDSPDRETGAWPGLCSALLSACFPFTAEKPGLQKLRNLKPLGRGAASFPAPGWGLLPGWRSRTLLGALWGPQLLLAHIPHPHQAAAQGH